MDVKAAFLADEAEDEYYDEEEDEEEEPSPPVTKPFKAATNKPSNDSIPFPTGNLMPNTALLSPSKHIDSFNSLRPPSSNTLKIKTRNMSMNKNEGDAFLSVTNSAYNKKYGSTMLSPSDYNQSRRSMIPVDKLLEKQSTISRVSNGSQKKKRITIICKRKSSRNGSIISVERQKVYGLNIEQAMETINSQFDKKHFTIKRLDVKNGNLHDSV